MRPTAVGPPRPRERESIAAPFVQIAPGQGQIGHSDRWQQSNSQGIGYFEAVFMRPPEGGVLKSLFVDLSPIGSENSGLYEAGLAHAVS